MTGYRAFNDMNSFWMEHPGVDDDVVISSRVRLARNSPDFPAGKLPSLRLLTFRPDPEPICLPMDCKSEYFPHIFQSVYSEKSKEELSRSLPFHF